MKEQKGEIKALTTASVLQQVAKVVGVAITSEDVNKSAETLKGHASILKVFTDVFVGGKAKDFSAMIDNKNIITLYNRRADSLDKIQFEEESGELLSKLRNVG